MTLHNLIPHIHDGVVLEVEAPSSIEKNLFDWIVGVFKTDLGEGHLECFSVSDENALDRFESNLDFPPVLKYLDSAFIVLLDLKLPNYTSNCLPFHFILKKLYSPTINLRGPPFCV